LSGIPLAVLLEAFEELSETAVEKTAHAGTADHAR
jgi:hypothetical protein